MRQMVQRLEHYVCCSKRDSGIAGVQQDVTHRFHHRRKQPLEALQKRAPHDHPGKKRASSRKGTPHAAAVHHGSEHPVARVQKSAPHRPAQERASEKPMIEKVVFFKTASTGGSTITGILHRFCDNYNKQCNLQYSKKQFERGGRVGLQTSFNRADIKKFIAQGRHVDMWSSHVMGSNVITFEKLVPGSFKFSIFREPHSRVLSSFRHCNSAKCPIDALKALQANRDYRLVHHIPHKSRCGDMGHVRMSSFVSLKVIEALDLVLLTEEYDRSMMILRRRLNWPMQDLLYLKFKSHHSMHLEENAQRLGKYLAQDRKKLNLASRNFVDRCFLGTEKKLYARAKEIFAKQWR
eukprot:1898564-Amphidinium_carterae.1